jgi:hypothetical protein
MDKLILAMFHQEKIGSSKYGVFLLVFVSRRLTFTTHLSKKSGNHF